MFLPGSSDEDEQPAPPRSAVRKGPKKRSRQILSPDVDSAPPKQTKPVVPKLKVVEEAPEEDEQESRVDAHTGSSAVTRIMHSATRALRRSVEKDHRLKRTPAAAPRAVSATPVAQVTSKEDDETSLNDWILPDDRGSLLDDFRVERHYDEDGSSQVTFPPSSYLHTMNHAHAPSSILYPRRFVGFCSKSRASYGLGADHGGPMTPTLNPLCVSQMS